MTNQIWRFQSEPNLVRFVFCSPHYRFLWIFSLTNLIIQNEKNGYLIPVGNEKELAKKIELLIYNQEKREEFINNNKINRQQYTIVNVIKKHEEIFKEK